ncbi:PREDICTED: synaptogyrin-2-like isoform X2 [Priapulus caudatus]|uniref:Synaptogyrin n=1 Tax=Priapulus caudatus TaxID=37621 RepID=A0ABM1EGQ7_PRICU|nr:PREDICTED: synaptogyrin-2-like isoform X1 [Priapulus caudatus]XP_014671378.1 PREDICTED: synaptogyrin-2-like isoform X2 [Priapulus caudatus]
MMDGNLAYGAGPAGQPFDPLTFIKKPTVILRLLSLVFSLIVFSCIASEGWFQDDEGYEVCQYNMNSSACHYGTGIGVLAFLGCVGFLVADALFENITSVKTRKHVVVGDMIFSALWTLLWFIGFCFLANTWSKTPTILLPADGFGKNNVQAAIAFSFFSIFTWAGLSFFAVKRFRDGVSSAFAPAYDPDSVGSAPAPGYSAYPGAADDNAQPGFPDDPFGGKPAPQLGQQDYQPPMY